MPTETAPKSTHLVDYLRAQEEQARARKAKKAPKRADAQPEVRTPRVLPRPEGRMPRPPLAPGTLPAPNAPRGKSKGKSKGPPKQSTPRPPPRPRPPVKLLAPER